MISESLDFTDVVYSYFGGDEEYLAMQQFLLENPTSGNVIPGTGSLRKLRWLDAQRRKGKRGGLRVIYLYLPDFERLVMLDVYGKNEQDDIPPEDRREMKAIADEIQYELSRKKGLRRKK